MQVRQFVPFCVPFTLSCHHGNVSYIFGGCIPYRSMDSSFPPASSTFISSKLKFGHTTKYFLQFLNKMVKGVMSDKYPIYNHLHLRERPIIALSLSTVQCGLYRY